MSELEEKQYPLGYQESRLYNTYPEIYDAVFVEHRNIFISGRGGTGKSYTIDMIKEESDRLDIVCNLTSTTGGSAHSIRGVTIHRFSGIRLGKNPLEVILKDIRDKPKKVKLWKHTQILVIDEVSMLGAKTIDLINNVGINIRLGKRGLKAFKNSDTMAPVFGGIQLIIIADFLQLMPIEDKFAFQSDVWNRCNFVDFILEHPFRFPDLNYFNLLSRIRVGEHTLDDIALLRTRIKAYEEYKYKEKRGLLSSSEIKPTRIYALKTNVKSFNLDELDKLEGDNYTFSAHDAIISKNSVGSKTTKLSESDVAEYTEYMDNIAPREVSLALTAQVILTANLDVELGLVNGSRGIVEECTDESIKVKFRSGNSYNIDAYPYEYEDESVTIIRSQFPLILGWASTFNKNQGMTLDCAIIDLGTSLFAPGQAYVGLSRCRTLDGVMLINLIPEKIKPHPEALMFERELVKRAIHLVPVAMRKVKQSKGEQNEE